MMTFKRCDFDDIFQMIALRATTLGLLAKSIE